MPPATTAEEPRVAHQPVQQREHRADRQPEASGVAQRRRPDVPAQHAHRRHARQLQQRRQREADQHGRPPSRARAQPWSSAGGGRSLRIRSRSSHASPACASVAERRAERCVPAPRSPPAAPASAAARSPATRPCISSAPRSRGAACRSGAPPSPPPRDSSTLTRLASDRKRPARSDDARICGLASATPAAARRAACSPARYARKRCDVARARRRTASRGSRGCPAGSARWPAGRPR